MFEEVTAPGSESLGNIQEGQCDPHIIQRPPLWSERQAVTENKPLKLRLDS